MHPSSLRGGQSESAQTEGAQTGQHREHSIVRKRTGETLPGLTHAPEAALPRRRVRQFPPRDRQVTGSTSSMVDVGAHDPDRPIVAPAPPAPRPWRSRA